MNSSDPTDRLERMKKVLGESYPRVIDERRKDPLPASVRAELGATSGSGAPKSGWAERLLSWLRGPQLVALGAAAVVVLVAVIALGPADKDDGAGQAMRSGGGTASAPPVVVLRGLDEAQLAALRDSGYFRPEQLLVVPAGMDLPTFLAGNRQPNLILVDASAGEISAPFAGDSGPAAVPFEPGESDLAPLLLDMLADLPEPESTR